MKIIHFFKYILLSVTFLLSAAQILASNPSKIDANPIKIIHYDLEIKANTGLRRIGARLKMRFRAQKELFGIIMDLSADLKIVRVIHKGDKIPFTRNKDLLNISFTEKIKSGNIEEVEIIFGGKPPMLSNKKAPGAGFFWGKDEKKISFSQAVSLSPASNWWPSPRQARNQADSARISIILPRGQFAIANGKLRGRKRIAGDFIRWSYATAYPVSVKQLSIMIGNYVHFIQPYGDFKINFFVLEPHKDIAQRHFLQVRDMMECMEEMFGPYPFPQDGISIVEAPISIESGQSTVIVNSDFSNYNEGFDAAMVESAARNWISIEQASEADRWIVPVLTLYAKIRFMECLYNADTAHVFLLDLLKNRAVKPSNAQKVWMLHSIRNMLNDDKLWFQTIEDFVGHYRHQDISSETFITYFNRKLKRDLSPIFDQFLQNRPPVLEYEIRRRSKKFQIKYKWNAYQQGFDMPAECVLGKKAMQLKATTKWQEIEVIGNKSDIIKFITNKFYYISKNIGK